MVLRLGAGVVPTFKSRGADLREGKESLRWNSYKGSRSTFSTGETPRLLYLSLVPLFHIAHCVRFLQSTFTSDR